MTEEKMANTELAQKILDEGLGNRFIEIVLNMIDDGRCDLNGKVGHYVGDLLGIIDTTQGPGGNKIRPCRFCGCKTIWTFHYGHYDKPWVCECVKCLARGPHGDTEEEAIELWNRGVVDDKDHGIGPFVEALCNASEEEKE